VLAADADPSALAGLEVVDRRGERIGRVRQVYTDGGSLGWVGVRGNLFGTEEALVPLDGAVLEDDVIGVPVERGRFHVAPRRRPDAALDEAERRRLRRFWSDAAPSPLDDAEDAEAEVTGPEDAAAPEAVAPEEDGPGVMTASEERLRVEMERVPRSRVRLRKVVVTEQRTLTVPVRREEYRLVREPITGGLPVAGRVIAPDEQELVLYEERVVVTTEVVPVERIRLVKEEVVGTRQVSGEVRRERIELVDVDDEPEDDDTDDTEDTEDTDGPDTDGSDEARQPGAAAPQPSIARAIATKRSTSRRSPRRAESTPARSSTSAADDAPPSTGASD
jgi:uncharacterized protein (TIGR02271 family)